MSNHVSLTLTNFLRPWIQICTLQRANYLLACYEMKLRINVMEQQQINVQTHDLFDYHNAYRTGSTKNENVRVYTVSQ
jgi:hypothetical protein